MNSRLKCSAFLWIAIAFLSGCAISKNPQNPPLQPVSPSASEKAWKIGGKLHFEEAGGSNYLGIKYLNALTREQLRSAFKVHKADENTADNAKVLLKKTLEGRFVLSHYEEPRNPGVGEEMHATLLYTRKRGFRDSETLQDVYPYLRQLDPRLAKDEAPSIEAVAAAYGKLIQPEWRFEITHIVLQKGDTSAVLLAHLLHKGQETLVDAQGHPVSAGLHLTLASIDASVFEEDADIHKLEAVAVELDKALKGKHLKVGTRNGKVDTEFGLTGSRPEERVRPGNLGK